MAFSMQNTDFKLKCSNIFGDIFSSLPLVHKGSITTSGNVKCSKASLCKSDWPIGLGVSSLRFQDSHKFNITLSDIWVSTDNDEPLNYTLNPREFVKMTTTIKVSLSWSSDEMFKAALYKKAINVGKVDITCNWFPWPVCKCLHN